jgi:hypothetical protein
MIRCDLNTGMPLTAHYQGVSLPLLYAHDLAPAKPMSQHQVADLHIFDWHLTASRRYEVACREAFRRRPKQVCARVSVRVDLGDIGRVVIRMRQIQAVRLNSQLPMVCRHSDLDSRHTLAAPTRAATTAE